MKEPARRDWREFFMGHVLPASVFTYLLIGRAQGIVNSFQHPGSSSIELIQQIVSFAFLALVVVLFVFRRPTVLRSGSAVAGIIALGGTFLLSIPFPTVGLNIHPSMVLRLMSEVLVFAGFAVSIVSLAWLGRNFGIRPDVRGLVTSGPYRWVRHHLYLGEFVFCLGYLFLRLTPFMVAVFFLWCALQYYRILLEESALGTVFPEYEDYRRRTHRIIPFIY